MQPIEVQQFIDALGQVESSRQYDTMVSLFAEDCKVGNVLAPEHFEGHEGASKFWQDYRTSFGEIRSE
ncbi:MAG TPA: nuclear transport factor 2 family protein, partial [Bryobacteraceae bacterium]|nr:nuclear transport factor 2 family protein [Bryobacteraceae bacterium]